jgi:hypothetical protein
MHAVDPSMAIPGKLSQHTYPLGQSAASLHWIFTVPTGQDTAFGVQVPSCPPSGGFGAQHALVLVMQLPASPPQGTNPGLHGAPPSGMSHAGPLSAASIPLPSPPASPAPLLLLLLLLDELEPLLLPLPLEELAPLLLLLLEEPEPLLVLPKPLLPPLPLPPAVESKVPLSAGLFDELLHCTNTNGAAIAMTKPSVHSLLGFIDVLLGTTF